MDKSSSPCPFAAITDNGIVINCAGCVKLASLCAKLKITPPLEGVAYIIPWGVWYIKGGIIDGCCAFDDVISNFDCVDVDDAEDDDDDDTDEDEACVNVDDDGTDGVVVVDEEIVCEILLLWLFVMICCCGDWKFALLVFDEDVGAVESVLVVLLMPFNFGLMSASISTPSLSLLSLVSAADIFSSCKQRIKQR